MLSLLRVFLLNRFLHAFARSTGRQNVVVTRRAGIGILTLLAVNGLCFRRNLVSRLALLLFSMPVILALTLTRLTKALVTEWYKIRPRDGNGACSEFARRGSSGSRS